MEFPDLFRFDDGRRVKTPADWRARRTAWLDRIVDVEYGGLPPATPVAGRLLHRHGAKSLGGETHEQHLLSAGPDGRVQILLDLLLPAGNPPHPVVLNGDGCWLYLTEEIMREILRRGYALARFNRLAVVPDDGRAERDSGLYGLHPGSTFGALSAWAWGYHRCVDFLTTRPEVDASRIAVTGHSRGGKTVLLAAATDERIALTAPNESGCGGAGSFLRRENGCETIADILRAFPYWFGPKFRDFIDREEALPFDQHALKAAVAPRPLLDTEALGDLWANPGGAWQTHIAAREVYRFLGHESRIGYWSRPGEHEHGREDWAAFLDFADWHLRGIAPPAGRFGANPFPEAPRAFSWSAPA